MFRRSLTLERLEPRQLLSITVNTLNDELDGNIHDGDVSLRDALLAAAPFETINFDPALTQSGSAILNLKLGELRITKDVVIEGPGSALLTIDASGNDPTPNTDQGDGSRVFTVNNGSAFTNIDVTINGLNLTGGDALQDGGAIRNFENLTGIDLVITGNAAHRHGGAVFSSGSLVLINSTVSGNTATGNGGAIFSSGSYVSISNSGINGNSGLSGGGIAINAPSNYLTISNSEMAGNHATSSGGAIQDADGNLRILDSTFSNNSAGGNGGVLDLADSVLLVTNSTLSNNRAYSGNGGALHADSTTTTITGTTLNSNSSGGSGGAISVSGGTLTLTGGSLSFNNVSGNGGAIYADAETVDLQQLTITGNTAANGGGIWTHNGSLSVTESTISGNRAFNSGGAVFDNGAPLTILSSTISGNSALGDGGGLWIGGLGDNGASIQNSTITQNTARLYGSGFGAGGGIITNGATVVSLSNTVLAKNYHATTLDDLFGKAMAFYSLIGVDSGALLQNIGGSLIGTSAAPIDPLLAPLGDNGGPTQTHLPLPGSPVIDAGDPSATAGGGVPLFDQRGSGFDRIRNGDSNPGARIDIGAVEIQPGSIHGQKWSDLNGDGVHDSNEPGLSGWTIYLDMNHNDVFDTNQAAIEPDDYSIGTDLSSIVPGATLSYAGSPGSIVTANAGVASTGSQVIGGTWDNGTQLRVDFANPTNFVGIDVVSDDEFDLGILEAFDAGGNLLATYFSAPLTAFGQFETISISRPTADIAYVLASGYNGEAVYLDNLRFGSSEPFRVTDPDGNYSFPELPPGTYQVGEVAQPGWQQTSPSSLASTLAQITANSAAISALVPSRFDFSEGDVGSAIFDGGNDMYDGGNVLGTEFSSSIAYTNGVVTPGDLAFGPGSQYFTAKFPGLFVMAANNTSINSFAISGDNGADGGGSTFADQLSTTVNGQLYTIYVKRVYNAGDPSINHILIVPGNGAGITHTYSTNTNDDYDNLLSLSSVHQIYYALVARQNGLFLSSSDVLNIANELLSNVGSVLTQSVTVNSGQATDGVDFGNHPLPGSIRGQLWYDTNGDGIKDPGEPPLEGWTVFLDTNHDGTLNGETVSVSSTDVPRLIFDSLTTYSTISVTGLHSINDLDVFLDIAHTFDSGLQVFLTSPNGTRVHLFGGVGGSGDNFMSTTLDDEAATGIGDGIAPFDGSFRPQELLSAFDGQDPNGIWTLEVSDTLSAGFGVLNNWSLNITDSEPTAVTDADGNYSFSDLPYGSYLVGEVLPNGWKQTHPGGPAATNLIANGGFETGDFGGWTLENSGSGTFVVNNGSVFPTSGDGASVPFDGAFSALTDQSGPGTHSIYQDVAVPVGSHLTLNWVDRIHNLAGSFIPPLQQYRVEFRDAGNNVIATPFSTQLGDLSVQDWTPRSVDLSAYAGQTIRIAFVEEDNFGYFNLGLDDVAITSSNGVSTISVMVHPGESVGGVQFGNQLTLRGDFNLDGSVDAADYIVWRQALGHSGATFVDADASGNGIIDDADYNIWRNHFGESVPPPSSGASFRSVEATAAPAPQNAAIANFTGVDHPATFNELAPGYRHFTPVPDANGIHHNVALFLGTNRAPAPNADLAVLQPHSLKVRAIGLSNSPITLRRVVEAAVPPAIRSATRDDALLYYLSLHLPAHVKVTADAITADSLPDAKSEQRVDSLEEAFDQVGDDEFWKLPELTA